MSNFNQVKTLLLIIICQFLTVVKAQEYDVLGTIAHVSDYGCYGSAASLNVSTMVKSWNPDIIISSGDDNYARVEGCGTDIDQNVGYFYKGFLQKPEGLGPQIHLVLNQNNDGYDQRVTIYPKVRSVNCFYPVPGNHDYEAGLEAWREYFTHSIHNKHHKKVSMSRSSMIGVEENMEYYDFKYDIEDGDSIHFFALNVWQKGKSSGCKNEQETAQQCDEIYYDPIYKKGDINPATKQPYTEDSEQYAWLKRELKKSTAMFKIVYMHLGPYTSIEKGGEKLKIADQLKTWGLSDLGVDAVISGDQHFYELNWMHDTPFFVNGLGGKDINHVSPSYYSPGNMVHYERGTGAIKIEAIKWPNSLKDVRLALYQTKEPDGSLISQSGTLIHEFFLRPKKSVVLKFGNSGDLIFEIEQPTSENINNWTWPPRGPIEFVQENNDSSGYSRSYISWAWISQKDNLKKIIGQQKTGFTLEMQVKTNNNIYKNLASAPFYEIFNFTDYRGMKLFGLRRMGSDLFIHRYNDLTYPAKPWVYKLWEKDVFRKNSWHTIYLSVKEDIIRVKVYQEPNADSERDGLKNKVTTELIYLGYQSLKSAKYFTLGNRSEKKNFPIKAIKNFQVYDRAFNYEQMDAYRQALVDGKESPYMTSTSRLANHSNQEQVADEPTHSNIYPNASNGSFVVSFHMEQAGEASLRVVSMDGQEVYKKEFAYEAGQQSVSVDLTNHLPDGIYIVNLKAGDKGFSERVVIRE